MSNDLEQRIRTPSPNPKNLGAMENADSVGTVGSPDCGDMLRMWVKFKEDDQGRKVIDRRPSRLLAARQPSRWRASPPN